MSTKVIDVKENQKGKIIGRKGLIIKRIQNDTGAVINARPWNKVHLKGSESQIDAAEREIRQILSDNTNVQDGSLLVTVPAFAVGAIIGKQRRSLRDIEEETGTQIFPDKNRQSHFYLYGNAIQQYKAKLKIKEKASNCRRLQGYPFIKKFPFIDDRHVDEDTDFALESVKDNPHPRWIGQRYQLVSEDGQPLQQERDSPEFSKLCGEIKDILRSLQQREENANLLVDMWCHYGLAYITAVDEDEAGERYSLREVKERLERKNCPWIASFIGGVRDLDVHNIEKVLSDDQTVPPYTRCDISFFSPSCRQIRVKIFLKGGENGEELVFCDDGPVVIKNVLERVSRDNGLVYYLCAPPVQHIKVHIFLPFVNLDCHFMIRTTYVVPLGLSAEKREALVEAAFLKRSDWLKDK